MTAVPIPAAQEPITEQTVRPTWYRQLKALFDSVNALDALPRPRLTGQVTVTGAATTGVATLASTQAAATYALSVVPVSVTGTPAANSSVILSIAKTTTTFTVTVAAAPGVGNSVTFDYVLLS
jgi:hypothetical protein